MPTVPPASWYDIEMSKAELKPVIDVATPVMQEVVNFGVALLARSVASAASGIDDAPPLMSYRHLLEMVDGCIPLVRDSCSAPMIPPLRSAFESLLNIEYMLESDTERRCKAFTVGDVHRRWAQYKYLDPRTDEGKAVAEARVGRLSYPLPFSIPFEHLDKQFETFEVRLAADDLASVVSEWNSRHQKNKYLRWYTLFNGPRNIRALADHLGRLQQYHTLYSWWSDTVHASNVLIKVRKGVGIKRLRDGSEIRMQSTHAIGFALNATMHIMKRYRQDEWFRGDFKKWYENEIRVRYSSLTGRLQEKPGKLEIEE